MESDPSKAWFAAHFDLLPRGPSHQERDSARTSIVAEAWDDDGRRVRSQLKAPEAYTLTIESAPSIAQRVLAGDFEPGFQTPARVYGADFALSFADVTRRDLDDETQCGSRTRRASG
jgi:short subunit dehydrogenase-like uncharacterized protein